MLCAELRAWRRRRKLKIGLGPNPNPKLKSITNFEELVKLESFEI